MKRQRFLKNRMAKMASKRGARGQNCNCKYCRPQKMDRASVIDLLRLGMDLNEVHSKIKKT